MSGRTAAGFTIALALVVAPAPAASAQEAPPPAEAAAGWLARQLVDGDHMTTEFDGTSYPDHGLTADVVLALDAGGVAQDSAAAATAWLAANAPAYLGDGTTSAYAGAHAKLAIVAQAQGVDPADFGGVDLLTRLAALQTDSGRFSDKSEYGDFSNGITQALAVLALDRADRENPEALAYLLGAACADGGFPLLLEQDTCTSDVDATGYAVQAVLAADGDATAALDWLEEVQHEDGGFGGSDPTPGVNTNSTGLAATALAAGGRQDAADAAVAFLLKHQVGCSAATANRGAIAYDGSGFAAASAARSTAQAIPGITGVSLADVTADGAAATAPTLVCAAPPTTTEPTTAPPTSAPATTTAPAPQGRKDPELANTGVEPAPAAAFGGLLLLVGVGLVVGARPRPPAGPPGTRCSPRRWRRAPPPGGRPRPPRRRAPARPG